MTAILIVLTALGFGAGDFFGGMASRKVAALAVSLFSQLIAGALAAACAFLLGGAPTVSGLLWGFAAGLMVGFGIVRYYHGLTQGAMGWVATVMGVFSAVVPFLIGTALGERPSVMAIMGVVTVTFALFLVIQRKHDNSPDRSRSPASLAGVWDGALTGIFFGLSFVFLGQSTNDNPLWPVSMVMVGSVPPILLLWLLRSPGGAISSGAWGLIGATGVCQGLGFTAFALAVLDGYVSIVSVAGALSPVATSLLAFGILCERLTRVQVIGVLVALVGIVCLVIG
ncbi:MAG: DMT family transporter [Verrucomicrobiia bacterium]